MVKAALLGSSAHVLCLLLSLSSHSQRCALPLPYHPSRDGIPRKDSRRVPTLVYAGTGRGWCWRGAMRVQRRFSHVILTWGYAGTKRGLACGTDSGLRTKWALAWGTDLGRCGCKGGTRGWRRG
eukprot:2954822-Rhodomonas_salina.1